MILLDIPQGAITIASAILVVVAGALVTFAAFLFRQLFSIRDRLKTVETKSEILWEQYLYEGVPNLRTRVAPPGNPMLQERWDELLEKLEKETLLDDEAEELLAALLKRREQAKEEDDVITMMLLGPGIVLTKWRLRCPQNEKELRERK